MNEHEQNSEVLQHAREKLVDLQGQVITFTLS